MIKPIKIGALAVAGALALAACSGGSGSASALVVGTDLPLQGASADASKSTNEVAALVLEQAGGKAGDYTVEIKEYDDSTAAKGAWDDAACAKNAQDHVANTAEVAVMGTYNSGCAKIIIPVLNQAGMLMISHANTYPGLTVEWDKGEPGLYYPSGARNYARVIAHDGFQGTAAAQFLFNEQGVKNLAVLDDTQAYGIGIADAVQKEFEKLGGTVFRGSWDVKQTQGYTATFEKIKASGATAVYYGGIFDNNGVQLVKDKTTVLGDNKAFLAMSPDGFSGYPTLREMPEAEGLWMTFAGKSLDGIIKGGGAPAKFIEDYTAKYGAQPNSSYAVYGGVAMQVILKAIAASDGTRKGVLDAVFAGDSLCLTAEESISGMGFCLSTETGDVDTVTMTLQQMTGGVETDIKTLDIK
ncbi:MAG: amino acid ABC transporter substrate-binding protein [Actinobacteria bacterium]|nr:amino acid ABC transporter substrate-binding protein [Actinomycetota bacterium]